MQISININGKMLQSDIAPDMLLVDFLRDKGCMSVKRGCDTGNCGACTVFMDGKNVLSCGVLAARADGSSIVTLEGMQKEVDLFTDFLAQQGADQCGFCNSGYIMNAMALLRENPDPSDEDILEYLEGNLCRCSGYESQLRGIKAFLSYKKGGR